MTEKSKNDSDKFAPWRDLKAVIGFFTRIPVPFTEVFQKDSLIKSVWAFPIAGLLIGAIGGLVFFLASSVGLTSISAALLAIGATAIITGALHEDGLADFFDGIWGGHTPERRLEIMRDSAIGGYGALALIISTGLKISALAGMNPAFITVSLIAAHGMSRGILPILMNQLNTAGKSGLAASVGKPDKTLSLIALLIGAAMTLGLLGPLPGISAVILAGIIAFCIMKLAHHKLGGYNGDTLGACQQICEICILLCCSAYFG